MRRIVAVLTFCAALSSHARPVIEGRPAWTLDFNRHIVLTVSGLPSPPAAELVLDEPADVVIPAEQIRDTARGLVMVILVQGTSDVLGPDGPATEVRRAVDVLARAAGKDGRVGLSTYGQTVLEVVPLYPRAEVRGEALGPASAYAGRDIGGFAMP